ncbi:MAG TPA: hypothetical protein VMV45_10095 [Casimicrobiaceae bacterium]|nr:hypothetical protein [Casimicrobiaceae bacterium]
MLKVKLEAALRVGRETLYPVPDELILLLNAIDRHGSLLKAMEEAGVCRHRRIRARGIHSHGHRGDGACRNGAGGIRY